jgi:ribosomal-protein-alanine N-acetyltransferase
MPDLDPLQFDPTSRNMRTPRLLLRPLHAGDAAALLEIYGDPQVTRFYDLDQMRDLAQAESMLNFFLQQHDRFALVDPASGSMLGTCGLFHWEQSSRMASIGYDLAPHAWGRGLMREAAAAVLAYGFERKQLNRVNALTAHDNAASARLLEALGFRMEGVLRQFSYWKGAFHDMRMYALLRDDPQVEAISAPRRAFAALPRGAA